VPIIDKEGTQKLKAATAVRIQAICMQNTADCVAGRLEEVLYEQHRADNFYLFPALRERI
jgi:hypothetical protein